MAATPESSSGMVGLRMGKNGYCASGMSGLEKREQLSICLASRRDELSRFPVVDPVPNRAFDMFMFTHGEMMVIEPRETCLGWKRCVFSQ